MIQQRKHIKRIIFDLHGVLLGRAKESEEREQVVHTIKELRKRSLELVFLTNSSTSSRKKIVADLAKIGVLAEEEEAWSSGHLMASYLNQFYRNKRVLVIGKKGFKDILRKYCREVLFETTSNVDVVVVANTPKLNQEDIERTIAAAKNGVELLGTSYDATVPAGKITLLGPKVSIEKVEKAMGQRALIVGKPNPYGFFEVLKLTNEDALETLIVGDSFETDIKWGKDIGAQTLLLTEKGRLLSNELTGIKADSVIDSMEQLLDILDNTKS